MTRKVYVAHECDRCKVSRSSAKELTAVHIGGDRSQRRMELCPECAAALDSFMCPLMDSTALHGYDSPQMSLTDSGDER